LETKLHPISSTDHTNELLSLLHSFGVTGGNGAIIGTNLGEDAVLLLRSGDYYLYLIDSWLSYSDYSDDPINTDQNIHYNRFLTCCENLNPFTNRYEIIPSLSLDNDAVEHLKELRFVFVDANHDFDYILNDLRFWFQKLKTDGWLIGHDFGLESVQSALNIFTQQIQYPDPVIYGTCSCWAIKKYEQISLSINDNMIRRTNAINDKHGHSIKFLRRTNGLLQHKKEIDTNSNGNSVWESDNLDNAFDLVAAKRDRKDQIDEANAIASFHLKYLEHKSIAVEIGCGFGRIMKSIADKSPNPIRIVGLDTSPSFLELGCNYCYPSSHLDLRLIINKYPISDEAVQYIYSHQVLLHCSWREIVHIFKECSRILKPGELMVHNLPTSDILTESINAASTSNFPLYYHSDTHIKSLAEYFGFSVQKKTDEFYEFHKQSV